MVSTYSDLKNKIALVTGASSGIGRASAVALAHSGVKIAVNYFQNQQGAEEAVAEIQAAGGHAAAFKADVRAKQQVVALVAETVAVLGGPIDILVNNAGSLVGRQRIAELSEELWDEVLELNLKSAFLCSQAVAPSMMDRRSGTIINMASIAGRNGGALGAIPYATAKGGLVTFTKSLAKEMALYGVRVNGINPGVIETPFHERFSTAEAMDNFRRMIPLGRTGDPMEIGEVVAFLASSASSFMIGESIEVNGGMWMD
jgi:NAD(P)-dependent dehydrogenase (short-subunit alcohol dehydrogenase family)